MKTLEQIKNDYAVSVGYNNWLDLEYDMYGTAKQISKHWEVICLLIQKECLELASENLIGSPDFSVDTRNAITNENNIIK